MEDIITLLKGGAISALLNKDADLPHRDLKGNSALIWCSDAGQVLRFSHEEVESFS